MKKLLTLSALLASAFTAQAQTNISYRITVDGVNTAWNYDVTGGKKDVARINGIVFGYAAYTNELGTNGVALAIGPWLKRQHLVLIDDYTTQKQAKDNLAVLAKLQSLLTANSDLLTAGDLSSLSTIAAKAP